MDAWEPLAAAPPGLQPTAAPVPPPAGRRPPPLARALPSLAAVTMVQRLTYRRRHSYATKSNKQRIVRTPGGKLVYQLAKKKTSHPTCPISGQRLNGVSASCRAGWPGGWVSSRQLVQQRRRRQHQPRQDAASWANWSGVARSCCRGAWSALQCTAVAAGKQLGGRLDGIALVPANDMEACELQLHDGMGCTGSRSGSAWHRRVHCPPGSMHGYELIALPCPLHPLCLQLPAVRPNSLHRVNKSKKTVHRAYGGHLAAGVVKERIVRAFLVEEQKIVKKASRLLLLLLGVPGVLCVAATEWHRRRLCRVAPWQAVVCRLQFLPCLLLVCGGLCAWPGHEVSCSQRNCSCFCWRQRFHCCHSIGHSTACSGAWGSLAAGC